MNMDRTLCREHLEQLLATEASALAQLDTLLNKEHRMITGNDIEGLEQAGAARDACITTLLRVDAERQQLCRAVGMSADKLGLKKLLNWCDPQGTLQVRWTQSTEVIRRCRTLNDRNGALVNSRLKRVEGMLEVLNGGQGRNERVYSSRGNAYQQTSAGRVCNVQA